MATVSKGKWVHPNTKVSGGAWPYRPAPLSGLSEHRLEVVPGNTFCDGTFVQAFFRQRHEQLRRLRNHTSPGSQSQDGFLISAAADGAVSSDDSDVT